MGKIFSFALGYLTENINSPKIKLFLDYLRKLGFQGVEITFATKERLYSYNPPTEIKNRLKQFKYLSIHSPFKLVKEAKNKEEIIKQLDLIGKLYFEIGAENVIIHPDELPPPEILKKYNFRISTENLKRKRNITISKLRKIFKKYPKIGFCVDTSHAYSWSKYETGKLIKAFKNRITQIHLSCRYKNKDHQSLTKASKDFLFSIAPIKKLNIPTVLEIEFKKVNLKSIRKESNCVKKLLGN